MKRALLSALFYAALTASLPIAAQSPPTRIRGAITAVDAQKLTVLTREGPTVVITLTDPLAVNAVVALDLAAIKPNSFIGTAAMKRPDGTLVAQEVLVFPESARGSNEGHFPWDLTPESTMTNAPVTATIETSSGRTMTLNVKGQTMTAEVPKGVPVVTFEPTDRTALKIGAAVFIGATKAADGSLSAGRVLVGKDGVVPPM